MTNDSPTPKPPEETGNAGQASVTPESRRGGIIGFFQQLHEAGREALAVVRGKPLEPGPTLDETLDASTPPEAANNKQDWKAKMLHAATDKLRGAADGYIATKLDEIEIRVDAKLDHIERRIDAKIVELHRQLRIMRDRELRHRLRILKITLIFTVLVACLSLLYKLLGKYWIQ